MTDEETERTFKFVNDTEDMEELVDEIDGKLQILHDALFEVQRNGKPDKKNLQHILSSALALSSGAKYIEQDVWDLARAYGIQGLLEKEECEGEE